MQELDWALALSKAEVDAAQSVRFRVLAGELGAPIAIDPRVSREISSLDNLSTTYHVLVQSGSEAVATARLSLANAELAREAATDFGFELEQDLDLATLRALTGELGEVARLCVLQRWRGTRAARLLYAGLYRLSVRLGVRYWIGGVDCRTPYRDEALVMRSVLERRGLVSDRFQTEARRRAASSEPDHGGGARAFYRRDERDAAAQGRLAGLRVAPALEVFTLRLRARCSGLPFRHPEFHRFVMPMITDLGEIPATTIAEFGRAPANGRGALTRQENAPAPAPDESSSGSLTPYRRSS
jgi:hypothetical protein